MSTASGELRCQTIYGSFCYFFLRVYLHSEHFKRFFPLEVRCSFHRYCCKTGTYYGYSLGGHICTTSSMYAFTNQPYDPSRTYIPANKQHTRYASPISPQLLSIVLWLANFLLYSTALLLCSIIFMLCLGLRMPLYAVYTQ